MDIEVLKRQLQREKQARIAAERIMESKALELHEANAQLTQLNEQLKAKYADSEQQRLRLLDSISDMVFNIDEEGIITFVNDFGHQLLGYENGAWIGKHFMEYIAHPDKNRVQETYATLIRKKQLRTYEEYRVIAADGSHRWFGQNVSLILSDSGKYTFVGVARDITHRRVMEASLHEAQLQTINKEHKYRSIIENMRLGLLEVNNEGYITKANQIFCQMTGYTSMELLGEKANDIFLDDDQYINQIEQQDQSRKHGNSGIYEIKITHKDGQPIWFLVSGTPLYNLENEVIGSIGIHYDISGMKRLETELRTARDEAERSKLAEKQFLANMSHEIRTPLNAVIGMSHLLADTSLSKEQSELTEVLSSSADILQKLINNILDLSKIEAGRLNVNHSNFDLRNLLNRTVKTFSTKTDKKLVSFEFEIDDGISTIVKGDELIINQILFNLIGNAFKFTNSGKVIFRSVIEHRINQIIQIRFEIEDSGIGIADGQIERIFQKFTQAHDKVRSGFGGTGLGLAISTKLVELLGGQIRVKSKLNEGSTFSFSLPFEDTGIPNNNLIKHKSTHRNYSRIKDPILVVDDNEMNRKYISKLLDKWHIPYELAINGQQALEQTKRVQYSLILMDIQMPIMDGYEASRGIKQQNNYNSQIPIIALTASTLSNNRQIALDVGMVDFLGKPFKPHMLASIFDQHLPENNHEKYATHKSDNIFEFDPALNTDYLDQVYRDDYSYAIDMFETFLTIVPDEFDKLKDAIASNNADLCRQIAHKIKPTFTMVGMDSLSKRMEGIEHLAATKSNLNKVSRKISMIDTDVMWCIEIVKKEIKKLKVHTKNLENEVEVSSN